jgi:hypothetical protein
MDRERLAGARRRISSCLDKKGHEDGSREDLHFSDIAVWRVTAEHPWRIYVNISILKANFWKHLR